MKRIYFVRHGQTQANIDRYFSDKNEPLNEVGQRQADIMAERTKSIDFDKLVASDFVRARQTAEAIAKIKGSEIEVQPTFGEKLEPTSLIGQSEDEGIGEQFINDCKANVENPDWRYEDGENYSDMFKRVLLAKKFLEEDESESIFVVSHSIFSRIFAAAILLDSKEPTIEWFNLAYRLGLNNTAISLFTIKNNKWKLTMWNDHAHFAE